MDGREQEIDALLKAVTALWRRYPQFRLGQLIATLANSSGRTSRGKVSEIEDTELNELAENMLRFAKARDGDDITPGSRTPSGRQQAV